LAEERGTTSTLKKSYLIRSPSYNLFSPSLTDATQPDIQCLHRIRSRLIQNRTALANQVRGLLQEYGIVIPQGLSHLRKRLPDIVTSSNKILTSAGKELFAELYEQVVELEERIHAYDLRIQKLCRGNEVCQRLIQVQGVGPLTATALIAAVGDAKVFKNGRQMAAWLGLVPRQCSSGGKQVLLGISKRGDRYLRSLLIHGARASLRHISQKFDAVSQWLKNLIQRRGHNKACVALANKNARILWALMAHGHQYKTREC
jgi:transposase